MQRTLRRELRLLRFYAIGSTLAMVVVGLATCRQSTGGHTFDEISVQRLNVVDPDGRLRMAVSNGARQAQATARGEPLGPSRKRPAGMIFFNEEGTELGGLVFTGRQVDGAIQASAGLKFDRYDQDETVTVGYSEQGRTQIAGLSVIDRPDKPLSTVSDLMVKREAAATDNERTAIEKQMMERMGTAADRVFVGRWTDGNATLVLRDAQARPRLTLSVSPSGDARLLFLDGDGRVVREIAP